MEFGRGIHIGPDRTPIVALNEIPLFKPGTRLKIPIFAEVLHCMDGHLV